MTTLNFVKILKSDGSGLWITIKDFVIGKILNLFGKNIKICRCDKYTREFYELQGCPQPDDLPMPGDNFENNVLNKGYFKINYNRRSELEKEEVKSDKQFLENDRKVLKFFAKSGKQFIIHYYLADDTVEIVDVHY